MPKCKLHHSHLSSPDQTKAPRSHPLTRRASSPFTVFCDYCDVYLTHDSMSVRKAHNSGRNHLRNVIDYYQQIGHEKAQSVIDSITSSYAAEGQAHNNPMLPQNQPGGAGAGAMGAMMGGGGPFGMGAPPGAAAAGLAAFPPPAGMPPFPPFPGGLPPPGFPGMPPPPGGAGAAPGSAPGGFPAIRMSSSPSTVDLRGLFVSLPPPS